MGKHISRRRKCPPLSVPYADDVCASRAMCKPRRQSRLAKDTAEWGRRRQSLRARPRGDRR